MKQARGMVCAWWRYMAVALLLLCLTGSLAYGQAFVGSTEELTTIKDASSDRLDHMLDSKGNKVQFTQQL